MEMKHLLFIMEKMEASDLYLSTGAPPTVKVNGLIIPLDETPLPYGITKTLAYSIMDEAQMTKFEKNLEMNFAMTINQASRFRVNVFIQRGEVALVVRCIKMKIPSIESLGLPDIIKELIMEKRGLILFVGSTGCGKSTSLASLIDYRNENSSGHIISIEDPIEFVHTHKKSIVNQREVGLDTFSYKRALKNTLRQAPDVILIGEIRSRETMEHALTFAETGHLCLSTLHANNANQAFDRIINFFPEERRNQILLDLSFNIRAIISQRLVPTLDGKRTVAIEILLGSPLVHSLIQRGEISLIKDIMERSTKLGMQTFDQALEKLYFDKKISFDEALRHADSKNNLRLKISLSDKSVMGLGEDENLTSALHLDPDPEHPDKNEDDNNKESGLSLIDE